VGHRLGGAVAFGVGRTGSGACQHQLHRHGGAYKVQLWSVSRDPLAHLRRSATSAKGVESPLQRTGALLALSAAGPNPDAKKAAASSCQNAPGISRRTDYPGRMGSCTACAQ
jgi:hypothetical protein